MAREKFVTRTFKGMELTALCLDTVSSEPFNETFKIPRIIKDEKKLQKYVSEHYDTDEIKYVKIVESNIFEEPRRMKEEFFFDNSEPIEKK